MGAQQSHAPAHVPDPPPGTPRGTAPLTPHLPIHGGDSLRPENVMSTKGRAAIGTNLLGIATGNSAMAHFTPPNTDAAMHNLTQYATETYGGVTTRDVVNTFLYPTATGLRNHP